MPADGRCPHTQSCRNLQPPVTCRSSLHPHLILQPHAFAVQLSNRAVEHALVLAQQLCIDVIVSSGSHKVRRLGGRRAVSGRRQCRKRCGTAGCMRSSASPPCRTCWRLLLAKQPGRHGAHSCCLPSRGPSPLLCGRWAAAAAAAARLGGSGASGGRWAFGKCCGLHWQQGERASGPGAQAAARREPGEAGALAQPHLDDLAMGRRTAGSQVRYALNDLHGLCTVWAGSRLKRVVRQWITGWMGSGA